ncbi:response regulator [Cohnella nanjingensis]|uniref:Response regulator transcription factor n=1 Tax=Cohnella nanjingensis TaxID=1387779 RepID=A0A7X0VEN1_9BACL|nr:response regulator transcription factor [Cohnella nanjingensis]MBB6669729.1 response regulator transcription factor [Cohnella nanjingensis]
MSGPWRIMLVDDHKHARQGMREIVSSDKDFTIVGEAASGEEALALMTDAMPDLVLMDISMPGMGGLEAAKAIKAEYPYAKIVIVTVSDDPSHLFEALKKGAQGFLLKNLNPSAWREYLRAVTSDEAPLNPELALSILREFANRRTASASTDVRKEDGVFREGLTPREKEILQEVARGRTNRDVASVLGLSEHTVKNHLKNILQKLHLDNRVQLTRYAYERGWVDPI